MRQLITGLVFSKDCCSLKKIEQAYLWYWTINLASCISMLWHYMYTIEHLISNNNNLIIPLTRKHLELLLLLPLLCRIICTCTSCFSCESRIISFRSFHSTVCIHNICVLQSGILNGKSKTLNPGLLCVCFCGVSCGFNFRNLSSTFDILGM